MRVPTNSFDAADLALCRAHGDAVFEHYPMPSFTADESARFKAATAYRAACDDFERVTLDQAQSDAYWQWQHEVHSRGSIGADLAKPGGDTTAITPAKPAATRPEPAAGVWNREDPPAPGVYVACHDFQDQRPQHYAHWSGMDWTITYNKPDSAMEGRRRGMISNARDYLWLRLIEADAPSAKDAS